MGTKRSRDSVHSDFKDGDDACHEMDTNIIEGDSLFRFLQMLGREVELAKLSKETVPEKIWTKQQFSIGINDTTRVLERMSRTESSASEKKSAIQLQAVLLASDCNPKWLIKHFPSLASSKRVPLIFIKDNKEGSLRLGELVKLKTAIAIGIKSNSSNINNFIAEVLDRKLQLIGEGSGCKFAIDLFEVEQVR